jgi:hypothetical protein
MYPPNRIAGAASAGLGKLRRRRRMECSGMAVIDLLVLLLLGSGVVLAMTGGPTPSGRRKQR